MAIIVDDLEKTSRFDYKAEAAEKNKEKKRGEMILTVFDALAAPQTFNLGDFNKKTINFGRGDDNDIILTSRIVSKHHGQLVKSGNEWSIVDVGSTNGMFFNDAQIKQRKLADGDFIRIDDGNETLIDGVLFVFSTSETSNDWKTVALSTSDVFTIGRSQDNTLVLPHISVSKLHAKITRGGDGYYIEDCGSTNGILINNKPVRDKQHLHEKDVIVITNSKLIFTSKTISYCCNRKGISVDASNVVIERRNGRSTFITCNHVTLNVKPGELVAIIGGSGAGKSTILNSLCGYLPPSKGNVYVNGSDLYKNFDAMKKLIGYVPQQDIVYDNLTLYDMLSYTAKLRLPADSTAEERREAIERSIAMVELTEKKDSLIKALSGGQKKRASIAVELLSDPNLIFLDEPASGLDPGTERNLMHSLRNMADSGKTVILVTHSTLQLKLCDKIVFMGKGGNLCFYGSYDEALAFFGVDDIVDVYNMITDHAKEWSGKYNKTQEPEGQRRGSGDVAKSGHENKLTQLFVLSARYLKLVFNDKQRLLLLIFQAPLLAALISLVADGHQFEWFNITQGLLFALSCSAFWIGMLNAIQEICKERTILRREYMTGLSLTAYTLSKLIVLGMMCVLQSILITGVFALLVGLPEKGIITEPFLEFLISAFLTSMASAGMGLFVSALFDNADRAMTVAPLLLLPQILFSGLIFILEGVTEKASYIAICRWSMEAFGTTADLNKLYLDPSFEQFYTATPEHLKKDWIILGGMTIGFLLLARIILGKLKRQKG